MINMLTVKELRPELPKVIKRIDGQSDRYIITKRGKPVVVMLSVNDYESLMETLDILDDAQAVKGLKHGQKDVETGKMRSWKAIKEDLGRL